MNLVDTVFACYLREVDILDWPVDEYGDSIDTENLIVIRVSEVGVEFCCGGDWQEPRRMLLYLVEREHHVREVEGETNFSDIRVDDESLQGLEKWLEEANGNHIVIRR